MPSIIAARTAGIVGGFADKHHKEAAQHKENHDVHEHEEPSGTLIDEEIEN